jgi:hypothetical protein
MKLVKQSRFNSQDQDLTKYVTSADGDLINIFNAFKGRIRFGDTTNASRGENIAGEFRTFTSSATPNAEFSLAHTLGATALGWIVINKNKAGDLYKGSTAWTSSSVYLKCSVASVSFTIFLLS